MNTVKPSYKILYPPMDKATHDALITRMASIIRTAYRSESKDFESDRRLVCSCVNNGHPVAEFADIIIEFTCSRAIANEITRHRLGSYIQESTRYVDYTNKNKPVLTFIEPPNGKDELWEIEKAMDERRYTEHRNRNESPEIARRCLPLDTATKLICKWNFRELSHILALRAYGTTGKPDPEMLALMQPLADELHAWMPEIFHTPEH